jgi:uncharacterized damage-inducible protein DinB
LVERWEQEANKLAAIAEAFPEEKWEVRSIDSVRTCGEVIRHVAFWNEYVAATLRGTHADDTANELPLTEYTGKEAAVEALKRTSDEVAAALRDPKFAVNMETAEQVVAFVEHTSEHYGQLVVYCRLNGIVPPASRA